MSRIAAADAARDRRELAALLALLATPGLSSAAALRLIVRHGTGTAACRELVRAGSAEVAAASRSAHVRERVQRARAAIESAGIQPVPWYAREYPAILRDRLAEHAPPLLFALGRVELLATQGIAVVGCRRASDYGLDVAEQLAGAIARAGGTVVSGLARGIDAAAHAASLDAGGDTIGVLGCGVDVYYPRDNMSLQDRIRADGLLLSEQLPGEPPRKHNFPHRNRIIAALSRAVVVVEAGAKSGAVTTANHAADQAVPVYCVLNAMHHENMQGNLRLLSDGACPFTSIREFLEASGLLPLRVQVSIETAGARPPADPQHARVWQALGPEPRHLDEVAAGAGMESHAALVALLELELDGTVRQEAGRRFARVWRRPIS